LEKRSPAENARGEKQKHKLHLAVRRAQFTAKGSAVKAPLPARPYRPGRAIQIRAKFLTPP
jgi:hypothetical protein